MHLIVWCHCHSKVCPSTLMNFFSSLLQSSFIFYKFYYKLYLNLILLVLLILLFREAISAISPAPSNWAQEICRSVSSLHCCSHGWPSIAPPYTEPNHNICRRQYSWDSLATTMNQRTETRFSSWTWTNPHFDRQHHILHQEDPALQLPAMSILPFSLCSKGALSRSLHTCLVSVSEYLHNKNL